MKCIIYSVGDKKEISNLTSLTLPGNSGELEILPGHAECFIKMSAGKIIFKTASGKSEEDATENSVCYLSDDNISIVI